MKEPTYSVFVRFRGRQRLTLKRSAPLDVALRFASEVRGERFHNPDDVFIVDDTSNEQVSEASIAAGAVETIPEAPPASGLRENEPAADGEDISTLLNYVDRWQLKHSLLTIRGGQRLTTIVENSLQQLVRLVEFLRPPKLPGADVEDLVEDAAKAIEHVRKVRDGLRQIEGRLQNAPVRNEPIPAPAPRISSTDVFASAPPKKRQGRGKS